MSQDKRRAGRRTARSVAVLAAGVLVISVADAAGRGSWPGGRTWGIPLYFAGEAVIFAPLAARMLARRAPGEHEAAALAAALAVATYLVKVCYSPAFFTFPDELEHWRTLLNLIATGHLFGTNYVLPVSPAYPGLEIVTSALVLLARLPDFAAGLLVAGLGHVLFTVALYTLFRMVGGQPRIALAAVTVYAMNPHYQVFDAIFGYQTLALAFFGLALVALRAAHTATRAAAPRAVVVRYWVLAAAFAAATVVTHHITSYVLAVVAVLITVAVIARGPRHAVHSATAATFAVGCAALVGLWAWRVAPITAGYLTPAATELRSGVGAALTGQITHSASSAAAGTPLADRIASYAVALLIMASLPFGWWRIWRAQRADPWALALGAGSLVYYAAVALPFLTSGGSELAGRLLTFGYIPVGYTLAMALAGLPWTRRWRAAAAGGAVVLLAGGLATGWPPWWERLPGGYAVDGFESGVTPVGVAAAVWAGNWLGPGGRIAADYTNNMLLGGYGGMDPVSDVNQLFCGPRWTADDALVARLKAVVYLVIDKRMSSYLPPTGSYFQNQAVNCPAPIPAADLDKFTAVRGVNRLYDSGDIVIYGLTGAAYAS